MPIRPSLWFLYFLIFHGSLVSATFLSPRKPETQHDHVSLDNQQQHLPQVSTPFSSVRTASPTQLQIFSWFSGSWFNKDGSSGDKNKKEVWGDDASSNDGTNKSPSSSKAGLGGVAGIMDSMENFKTAQQVGKMTNALVQELSSMTIEGQAAEGKVKVYFDGQQRPVNVQIDEGYLETVDVGDLNIALTTAMKDGYQKSSERMDDKMKSFYVDLGLKENK